MFRIYIEVQGHDRIAALFIHQRIGIYTYLRQEAFLSALGQTETEPFPFANRLADGRCRYGLEMNVEVVDAVQRNAGRQGVVVMDGVAG